MQLAAPALHSFAGLCSFRSMTSRERTGKLSYNAIPTSMPDEIRESGRIFDRGAQ